MEARNGMFDEVLSNEEERYGETSPIGFLGPDFQPDNAFSLESHADKMEVDSDPNLLLKTQIKQLEIEKADLQKAHLQSQSEVQQMQLEVKQMKATMEENRLVILEWQTVLANLYSANIQANQQLQLMQQERDQARAQTGEMQIAARTAEKEKQEMKSEAERLHQEVSKMSKKLDKTKKSFKVKKEKSPNSKTVQLEKMALSYEKTKQQYEQMQIDQEKTQLKLEEIKEERDKLQNKSAELSQQVSQLSDNRRKRTPLLPLALESCYFSENKGALFFDLPDINKKSKETTIRRKVKKTFVEIKNEKKITPQVEVHKNKLMFFVDINHFLKKSTEVGAKLNWEENQFCYYPVLRGKSSSLEMFKTFLENQIDQYQKIPNEKKEEIQPIAVIDYTSQGVKKLRFQCNDTKYAAQFLEWLRNKFQLMFDHYRFNKAFKDAKIRKHKKLFFDDQIEPKEVSGMGLFSSSSHKRKQPGASASNAGDLTQNKRQKVGN